MLLRRAVRRHRSNGQTLPRIREHLCTCSHVHKCGISAYPALKTARLFAYIPRRRKPNKMSAFGTLYPLLTRPPRGLLTPWGFAPHPTFATWQGCGAYGLRPPFPHPCRSVGVVAWRQGYGCAQHPHPFGARPVGAALRVRLPVLPLTPLHLGAGHGRRCFWNGIRVKI